MSMEEQVERLAVRIAGEIKDTVGRVDAAESEVAQLGQGVASLGGDVDGLAEVVGEVQTGLVTTNTNLDNLFGRVNDHDTDIGTLGGRITAMGNPEPGYDIIMLLGQSNMSGAGNGYDINYDFPSDQVWTFGSVGDYANRIVQATEPLQHWVPKFLPQIGPGMSIGRAHAARVNRRVLLVPAAMGATGFVAGAKRWTTTWTPLHENLYELAIRQGKLALQAAGKGSRIVGFMWHQGEADSAGVATYRDSMLAVIDGLRSRLSVPEAWFVIGQLNPSGTVISPLRTLIDAIHVKLPLDRDRVAFAYAPWHHISDDTTHFNADGQRRLGQNMADAVPLALANVPTSVPLPPTIVQAHSHVIGSAKIRVNRAACRFTRFKLEYRALDGNWTTFATPDSPERDLLLTSLIPGARYEVRVSTVDRTQTSNPSPVIQVRAETTPRDVTTAKPWRAYSLRRIDPDYTGSCVRVRRASDNAVMEVGFNADGTLDEEGLLAFCGTGDGFVAVWYNQTPTQNMSITNTPVASYGFQPKIVTEGKMCREDGKPVLDFDGVDDHLFSVNAGLSLGAFTMALTMRDTGSPDGGPRYWSEGSTTNATPMASLSAALSIGQLTLQRRGDDNVMSAVNSPHRAIDLALPTRMQTFMVTDDTASVVFRPDRRKMDPVARPRTASPLTLSAFTLGTFKRNTLGNPAKMRISEAVFWQSVLSDADAEAYIEDVHGFFKMDDWQ